MAATARSSCQRLCRVRVRRYPQRLRAPSTAETVSVAVEASVHHRRDITPADADVPQLPIAEAEQSAGFPGDAAAFRAFGDEAGKSGLQAGAEVGDGVDGFMLAMIAKSRGFRKSHDGHPSNDPAGAGVGEGRFLMLQCSITAWAASMSSKTISPGSSPDARAAWHFDHPIGRNGSAPSTLQSRLLPARRPLRSGVS